MIIYENYPYNFLLLMQIDSKQRILSYYGYLICLRRREIRIVGTENNLYCHIKFNSVCKLEADTYYWLYIM